MRVGNVPEYEARVAELQYLLKVAGSHPTKTGPTWTCIRLLFRTDTNDLAGGVRRGKGAMVISRTASGAHFRASIHTRDGR